MFNDNSADYYRTREVRERGLAAAAHDPAIAAIHRDMAERYKQLVTSGADQRVAHFR